MTSLRRYRRRDWPMPKPPPYPADDEDDVSPHGPYAARVLIDPDGVLGEELLHRLDCWEEEGGRVEEPGG